MSIQKTIQDFLASEAIAVVGVSHNKRGFGYTVYNDLRRNGYTVYPVNPNAAAIDGDRCYPDVTAIPGRVDAAILIIPPPQTEAVVRQVAEAGIPRVWMQKGAESREAIRFCEEHGIDVVSGECILLFLTPRAFPHNVHRWVRASFGTLPK